ncbi:hypothetical protein AMATHDRAFT_66125 [Amanita thiersii Skay4041]|uniref:DUF7223 domain-containing protein n=1 Tax=Amanita thiersii Skay4041 TaxID=703135 RepID=A0A2A9NKD8_9AGAR|nr:hypothetical protein AMATHDRAFT_66125 [Amanita thiersii Skay4041]
MLFLLPIVALSVVAVRGENDWSKPCFSGVCSYDLPSGNNLNSGTIKIWGSESAISDITTAAGWEILGCDGTTLEQDIRLVCSDSSKCNHLFKDTGAENTIVRLPESCGKGPFARVARSWISNDQSMPSKLASRLVRRDGSLPKVRALHLDTQFETTSKGQTLNVQFVIRAANIPGANTDIPINNSDEKRGFGDFLGGLIDGIKGLNDFDLSKSTNLPPIDINKNDTIFKESISCPPITAGLAVDIDAQAHAQASIGLVVKGTILPPNIDELAIVSNLAAKVNGNLTLTGDVAATIDSGKIKIFELGLPGLDFPGIFSLGPSVQLNTQAKATLDLAVGVTVGINYELKNAQIVFPPNSDPTEPSFSLVDTPLKLSATPNVKATGTVEAHLIPSLNFGLSALGSNADIFIAFDSTAVMKLTLEATGPTISTRNEVVVPEIKGLPDGSFARQHDKRLAYHKFTFSKRYPVVAAAVASSSPAAEMETDNTSSSMASAHQTMSAASQSASLTTAPTVSTSTTTTSDAATSTATANSTMSTGGPSFQGCFEIDAVLNFNVGANAKFFGLFDESVTFSFFKKTFQLFKKCFGSTAATKRSLLELSDMPVLREERFVRRDPVGFKKSRLRVGRPGALSTLATRAGKPSLSCLSSTFTATENVEDGVITASTTKQL